MNVDNIEIIIGGKTFTFAVEVERDDDMEAPWDNSDGHGPVSDWTSRDKRPGELVLSASRSMKRYYNFAEACRIALRDGWGHLASKPATPETPRQKAARAARADFEYLREWCNDEWYYVGVIVTLLDEEGEKTEISESLWGLESEDEDNLRETARTLADEMAGGYDVSWGEVTKTSYARFEGGAQ